MSKTKPQSKLLLIVLTVVLGAALLLFGYIKLVLPSNERNEQTQLESTYEVLKLENGAAPASKKWDEGSTLTVQRGWNYEYHLSNAVTADSLYDADTAILKEKGFDLSHSVRPLKTIYAIDKNSRTQVFIEYSSNDSTAGPVDVHTKVTRNQ